MSFTPLNDALFLDRAGIEVEERDRHADPATLARLLVFADTVLDDLDLIRENAVKVRSDVLGAYQEFVIERASWRR